MLSELCLCVICSHFVQRGVQSRQRHRRLHSLGYKRRAIYSRIVTSYRYAISIRAYAYVCVRLYIVTYRANVTASQPERGGQGTMCATALVIGSSLITIVAVS